jgi:hypothetical protein
VAEEHPWNHHHAASEELLATLGRGFCTPIYRKDGGQRVAQGAMEVGTTSLPVRISAYDRLSRPSAQSKPQI